MTNWKPEKNHVTYVCYIPKEERERERGKDRNMGLVTVDYSANIFLLNKGKGGDDYRELPTQKILLS